ncbi:MAG: hypothetical protein LBR28_04285 [Bacteroidales bacterium]|jgi:hypothetical protein|nr:hypothetical protein [Bacteroidales bacterium]
MQLFVLGLAPVLLWTAAFINPPHVVLTEFDMPFYKYIYSIISPLPLISTIIAFVIMILNGIFLNYIFTSNKLVQKTTYMPAFMYYLLNSSNYQFMTISSLLIMNFCLIVALWCFYRIYTKKESAEEIFTTSLIIALASMFYIPSLFFLLWLWIGLFIYKAYNLKKWLISLFGFITPFIFSLIYYYLTDQVAEKLNYFVDNFVHLPSIHQISAPIHVVYLAILGVLTVTSLFYVHTSKIENNIIYGKKCNILIIMLFVSILSLTFVMEYSEFSAFFSIPLSFIFTIFLFAKRKLLYSNIMLLLFIILTAVKIYFTTL